MNNDTLPHEVEAGLVPQGGNPSHPGASLDNASPSESRMQYEESHISDPTNTTNEDLSFTVPPVSIGLGADQRPSAMPPLVSPLTSLDMPAAQLTNSFGDFDSFIDSINGTYDGGI